MFELDDQVRVFGVTTIENLFFTEYLASAEGDFVKVYLCLAYHSQLHDQSFGVKELAAELGLEEARAEAALRYWERRRLLSRTQSDPPRYLLHHLGQRLLTGQDEIGGDRTFIQFSEAVYALFAERRKIRPAEIAQSFEWVTELKLPQHIVLMLLSHMISERGISFTFKSAEKVAVELKEAGIEQAEDAERFLGQKREVRQGAQKVLRRFGLKRSPSDDEMRLYRAWMDDLHFTHEDIQDACQETVKASNPTFGYLDGVLTRLAASRGAGQSAKRLLKNDRELLDSVKQVLDQLGLRAPPVSVKAAYQSLSALYPKGQILLAAKAVSRKGGTFSDLETCLSAWHRKGFDTEEKIRALMDKRERLSPLVRRVMDGAGMTGPVGDSDIAFVEKWLAVSSEELIGYAATLARGARQKLPYMDRVLTAWREKGVATKAEAEKLTPETKREKRTVTAQQYEQRDYSEDDLARGANALIEEMRKKREP